MKKALGLLTLVITVFFVFTSVGFAAEDEEILKIKPILPSNQNSEVTSYINIDTDKSSLKQDLEFSVTNTSDKPIKVAINPLNAITSLSGSISYTFNSDEFKGIDVNYRLADNIKMPSTVQLQPSETRIVKGELDVDGIKGTVLGAVGFEIVDEKDHSDIKLEKGTTVNITNRLVQVLGVQVNFKEKEEFKKLTVGEPYFSIYPSLYIVNLPVTNSNSDIYKDSEITYEVLDSDGNSLFKSDKPMKANLTPKSEMLLGLVWEADKVYKDGVYTVQGTIKYDGDKEVHFGKKLKLESKKTVDYSNNSSKKPELVDKPNWGILVIGIVLGLFLALLFLFLIKRKKKREEQESEEIIDNSHKQ